jgi:hypothetical protein
VSKTTYKRQKAARKKLDGLFEQADNTLVIHYSCESFYGRTGGNSPRITSIAVRQLGSGQTTSFSIHQVAERNHHDLNKIDTDYDRFEREMLDDYFRFVDRHQTHKWLHWNMRDINYGFPALEHRYRVLDGEPVIIHDSQKLDLARLLIDLYGVGYIGHPRLENLIDKNAISRLNFLTGAEEAAAFVDRNYVGLHQSTLRKVDVIANTAGRAHDRTLATNASWWELHGGSLKGFTDYIGSHPLFALFAGAASIVSLGFALYPELWPPIAKFGEQFFRGLQK